MIRFNTGAPVIAGYDVVDCTDGSVNAPLVATRDEAQTIASSGENLIVVPVFEGMSRVSYAVRSSS